MQKSEKNHWFYSEKNKKSKNHYKTTVFLKKRVVKPISGYGFGPWVSHTRLEML